MKPVRRRLWVTYLREQFGVSLRLACEVAKTIAGEDRVQGDRTPEMGAEDFSYLLEKRPGAYLFLGIGEAPGLHHPAYDFNDEASASGASFFAKIVETAQPL